METAPFWLRFGKKSAAFASLVKAPFLRRPCNHDRVI